MIVINKTIKVSGLGHVYSPSEPTAWPHIAPIAIIALCSKSARFAKIFGTKSGKNFPERVGRGA